MQSSISFGNAENFTKVCLNDIDEQGVEAHDSTCNSSPRSKSVSLNSNPILKVTHQRWLTLIAYCLLTTSAGSAWLCFPAVSNILQRYYDAGLLAINMLTIVFGIAIVVFSLPFAALLDNYGLAPTLKIAAFMNAIGASIRYFGASQEFGYWFLLIGNLFTAISVAGFLFLPGKISLTWFPAHELGKATSICIAFDALGSGLGFLHATYMIKNNNDSDIVKDGIQAFLFSQMVPAFVVFIFTIVCVRPKPKYAPNIIEYEYLKQDEERKLLLEANKNQTSNNNMVVPHNPNTLKRSIFKLLKNQQFNLIIHMQGIVASIEGIYEILLNEMLIEIYPGQEQAIGVVGFVSVILGFMSNIVVGIIIDKTGSYKIISFLIFFSTTICCIIWSILMSYVRNFLLKAVVFCFLMATSTAYYTIAFAHSSVVAPSIPPSATGVLLVLSSQVYDTFTSFLATEILNYFGSAGVFVTSIGICSIATTMSLFVKNRCMIKPQAV